jgi:hypothetical protein
MSNAFTNFLTNVAKGFFESNDWWHDYQHANRLYVQNNYARAPKFGFLYFVAFTLDTNAIKDRSGRWLKLKGPQEIGLLVKKCDLPKFSISTEVLNQYNRKTVIQTGIKYNNVNLEFHDDNSDLTRNFWADYYNWYFADGNYGPGKTSKGQNVADIPAAFGDTKYGDVDYKYGMDVETYTANGGVIQQYLKKIDIYSLHQHKFSQYTLINPKITEWSHDSVDQDSNAKVLTNKMTVAYETVLYSEGKIVEGKAPDITALHYDTTPSPLGISGTIFGPGGVVEGAEAIFGDDGLIENANTIGGLLNLGSAAVGLGKSISQLNKAGVQQEGLILANSILTGGNGQVTPGLGQNLVQTANNSLYYTGVKLFGTEITKTQGTAVNLTKPGG